MGLPQLLPKEPPTFYKMLACILSRYFNYISNPREWFRVFRTSRSISFVMWRAESF